MKSDTISTFPPSICHEVIGLDAMILVFWILSFESVFSLSPFTFTITHLSWGALHSMAHSFIELDKAVVHVIRLVSFLWLWFFTLSDLWWRRIRGLWKLPDGRDWLKGKLGLVPIVGAMPNKSLIQFSAEGQGCVPSLLFERRPNYGGGNKDNGNLLQHVPCTHGYTQCPHPEAGRCRPIPLPETPGHAQASLGQSLVGSLLLSTGSWYAQGFVCALQESVSPLLCKFWQLYGGLMATSKRTYAIPRSAAPRAPASAAVHCWPAPRQETPKYGSVSVSVGSLGPGAHKVCLSPLSISGEYGVWF